MEASFSVVIKVKYGDMLRRFNAPIVDDKLFLDVVGLREKILSLFSFAPDTDLLLTYVDEDGDVVALVDDDDLRDVVKQGLNPLRVTVKVNDDKHGNQNYSSASSPRVPNVGAGISEILRKSAGISEILRKVPEPLRDTLMKLSDELASKASNSSPGISELVDQLSKVSLQYLGQLSESGVTLNMQNGVPESSLATDNKTSELLKVDPAATLEKPEPAANMERNEVKIQNITGQRKDGPSFDFNAVAAALESQNVNVSKPESGGVAHPVRRKEKGKKTAECSNGKSHVRINPPADANNVGKVAEFSVRSSNKLTGKEICNSSEPKHGSNLGSDGSSDLMNGEYVMGSALSFENAPVPAWSSYKDGLKFGSFCGPSAMQECPFSGTLLENISAAPPHSASDAVPYRRNNSQNDSSGSIFHRGVRCDGCGIHPIVGPRFKSTVKLDYDLCRVCFEKMGNDHDYIRMDRPAVYRHHLPHFRAREHGAMFPHVYRGAKVKLGTAKLDSRFIQDVNIFDGTVMAPLTPFTKIWRMRNNGTVAWPQKTQLVWIGGDKLTDTHSVEVQIPAAGLLMDQELDVAIDFISPELPGRYISYWRMSSPSGQKFGQRVWVLIQVDASKEATQDIVRNLNLNLPPVSSSSMTSPEIINVNQEPVVEASRPYPKVDNSKKIVELGLPNTENELKFPINDSLLVHYGAGSSSGPSSASSSVPYPIIDLSDMGHMASSMPSISPSILFPMPPPPPPTVPLASPAERVPMPPPPPPPPSATVAMAPEPAAAELPANYLIEDRLLRELEEMGFKQVDLNKEVLRMNEYDLEQAVDDLCGVAEWDPILEELREMGFNDAEMNKKLLQKNNGSIKRVVMDLIAGEGGLA
ncbi:hypothetical protein C2S51_031516 [Perilla frutescens var. frutescens]|nr:hypothetical protein C2S51_031516 [Perilla frutescens var. frutescens]